MPAPIELLLIDQQLQSRQLSAQLFAGSEAFRLLASADSGPESLELVQRLQPDLVVLDLPLPTLDGLSTIEALKRQLLSGKLMVLTGNAAREDLLAMLRAGADGYLLKDAGANNVQAAALACVRGQARLAPMLSEWLLQAERGGSSAREGLPAALTEREWQTLELIAEGFSNKLIGRQLGISDGTVKIHVRHLLSKLHLHSRLELAAWVYRQARHRSMSRVLEGLPLMVYRCRNNPHWNMEYVSAGCHELTGYRAQQLIDSRELSYASLIHPQDRERVWQGVQQGLEQRSAFVLHYRLCCADGQIKQVCERGAGVYSSADELLGLEGVVLELNRSQAQASLLQQA